MSSGTISSWAFIHLIAPNAYMSAAQKTANGRSSFKIKMLEEKVKKFDYGFQRKCVEERDYEALEMYVIELLLEG